ncbi:alpha/beta fold hydrolase [Pseudomonas sp. Fl5BN2]|uniref:alpha/beta fold hydrolase n=1 Tax=unclassified Pseudomonas TaxID=196821 RepID=UPI0013771216|nr:MULTISPECIES: alpha/beta hydrolase [unclassified Pseudomonas]NBF05728.1 alpha/beta fold hydrolase [Pseudomonas sp. Fl5BN2]NBF11645.1 alpha/beta fold hydrolase [Pseudomonas sp. Fl4BN1]
MDWLVAAAVFLIVSAVLWGVSVRINRRIEREVPINGRFLDVAGERIHYTDEGRGPALLMIHGLSGCGRNLTHSLAPQLREQFRVITLDRPGSGYSTRARGAAADLPAQASLIASFIRTLDLGQPLVLGHSLGGAVALSLALDYPHAVSGLILVAPLTHPQRTLPLVFLSLGVRPAFLRRWLSLTLAAPMAMLGRRSLVKAVFAPDSPPEDFPVRGGGLLGMRSDNFYNASSEIALVNRALPDMVKHYPSLTLPVGLIYGSADAVLNYRKHGESMLGKVTGLSLEIVPGHGHMLPISAVEPVVAMVQRIAAQARPQRSATVLHPPFAASRAS